jgi:hypothetical protein
VTFIPIFNVEIPDRFATVMHSNYKPDLPSGRAVVCLTAVMNDGSPFGENLARLADERLTQILDILTERGVSLVCVEAMEGTRGQPDAMGAKVHERLGKGDVRVVGVDNLELESLMMRVWAEAQMSATRYDGLFAYVLDCIERRASQLATPSLGKFIRLRHDYEGGTISVGVLLKDLFELEEATRCYLPADIKKPLIAIRREAEMNVATANAEQQELIARLKKNASEGVLDPERVTTFRKRLESGRAPSQSELTTYEYADPTPPQEYSSAPLAPHEAAALAYFRLRLGVDPGNLVLSLSGPELEAYQSRHAKEKDDPRESCDMAQILGIGLNAYPNFCKFIESRQALRSIQANDPYQVLSDAAPKAFAYFEAEAFRGSDEREVMSCLIRLTLLKKLASLQLSADLYDQLVETVDDAFLCVILESLQSAGVTVAPDVLASARRFDERRDFFISFYDSARKRASGMALGTLQQMDQLSVDKAVLICLGFHCPTVKATLESEQIPFWMLYPITRGSSSAETSS